MPTSPEAYFERLDSTRFRPAEHTSGAWNVREQHIGPMVGLVAHLMEQHTGDSGLELRRLSFDILGVIAVEPFTIEVHTVRPGRTIELLEAVVVADGRAAVRARGWMLGSHDSAAVAGGETAPMAPPDEITPEPFGLWPGGFIASLEARRVRPTRPGSAEVWLRTEIPLLAGEAVSDLAAFCALVDTSNGISVRESPDEWLFPNLDLTIHLHRSPRGRWLGMRTDVVFGAEGSGLTSAALYDEHGPVGRAAQSLTVRPRV